ncbi:rod shape-determining protein [Candidatus Kaiserbacteria bacterium RIFCSPLOWO2_12_FULL_52_8]|uniref:Cell shape-determining protein MreB n=1 Tax=Candidatus Kaiserbacteria bacterium RIFCSPHIGHO2_01_FULL_53_31 TaxID=1798481 RepID=A0A1F6CJ78_9BACT|nr:MAG: rod shape-determining protein [Candidatus Kaiserbacteria bacterium RIFCSPHIGHO2_01_FULL_53_31]OGG94553.1 MAG: rod shape-determining protein [Candidatus Kaiserbacteria bacterium RIFCSPLOWO2_12_FULL_52_8]
MAKFSRNSFFSTDIAIDLGTSHTLVYVRGRGVVINEPSVVAINDKTNQVVAIGQAAKTMLGKTPAHIRTVRPLSHGVISDFEVTEELLTYFINKAQGGRARLFGPRIVIGVPTGVTNVQSRAVRDAAKNAGAREAIIIEEPVAGAIGAKLPVSEAVGTMVLDIGGGTTDIAVIALGGTVAAKSSQVAGDRFNENIIDFVRNEFKLGIGERTAEEVKIAIGAVMPLSESLSRSVRGRDFAMGLPREIVLTDAHIRDAITPSLDALMDAMKEVIEATPPELLSDVLERGVTVFGGGALLRGLPHVLAKMLGVPIKVAPDPLTTVVRGAGIVTENPSPYVDFFIDEEDILSEA